ncbi:MAG: choice-of-anchor J domain-containing protein, partial [Bacteroidales bacterium]|nr:choice-of-anchor J domain-containing protein [Bacteroidales bacterium]
ADGFFVLSELAPGTAGIGSGDGQYNTYNHVIYGIAPPNRLRVSATEVPMTVVGDSVIVRVFTADNSDSWHAETESDWLIIAVDEGEGYGQRGNIVLKADTNYSGSERRATVVVRQGIREATFEVMQYSCGSVTTLPYLESFEGYTTDCWYLETADGTYDSAFTIINRPSYIYEGEHSLQFAYSKRQPQRRQMLISPRFEAGTSMLLSFHYMRQWSYKEHFSVLYSTTDDAPESFIYLIGDGGMADAEWQTFEGIVPEEARYIAIVYDNLSEEGRNWVIDNISLTATDEQYGAVAEFPYTQSFETHMAGWSSLSRNVDNMAKYGLIESTQARTGQHIFRFTSSKTANDYNQYLVSPKLQYSGTANVSFYYRRSGSVDEKICLLYSTTGSTPECFSLLGDTVTVSQSNWTAHTAELPAGTRYVAINYCTEKGKYLYIDDIAIEASATEGIDQDIRTPKYSNIQISTTGRDIKVNGATGEVRLYDAAGRLIATKNAKSNTITFPAPSVGVYMLQTTGTKARKVVVY